MVGQYVKSVAILGLFALAFSTRGERAPLEIEILLNQPSLMTEDIVVAGSFNDWNLLGANRVVMQRLSDHYFATITVHSFPTLLNLYIQGQWDRTLATEFGKSNTCGILIENAAQTSIEIPFLGWMNPTDARLAPETITGTLERIEALDMPQLKRSGDLWVWLPESYQTASAQRYPVLYMLDGQNLFSEATSYSDEWRIDESLQKLAADVIVVGISNSEHRWQEYNPWDAVNYRDEFVAGMGQQTLDFITQTLKPYIDNRFRTLTEPAHTGIAGSSLGGLMALYASIEYAATFNRFAAFSPSFSFKSADGQRTLDPSQSNLIAAFKHAKANPTSKIYIDVGEIEYGSFELIDTLYDTLLASGYQKSQLKRVRDKMGRHCEKDWSRRFPYAYQWLFAAQ